MSSVVKIVCQHYCAIDSTLQERVVEAALGELLPDRLKALALGKDINELLNSTLKHRISHSDC